MAALTTDPAMLAKMLIAERQRSGALQQQVERLQAQVAQLQLDSKKGKKKRGKSKKKAAKSLTFSFADKKRVIFSTKEQVDKAFAPLIAAIKEGDPGRYSTINISGKSIAKTAAPLIAEILAQLKGVSVVDFHDTISGQLREDVVVILDVLCKALQGQKLHSLNLSDNALGVQGVRACQAAFVGQSNLRHLYFNNCGLDGDAAKLITELVLAPHPSGNSQLRTFEIHNNLLKDAGAINLAPLFAASPELRHLRFSTTRHNRPGSSALIAGLKNCHKFVWLDLSDFVMGKEAGGYLAEVLKSQSDLRYLCINSTFLEQKELMLVLKNLAETAPNLEVLKLNSLEISPQMTKTLLLPLLAKKTKLKELSLEGNYLKADGAAAVVFAVKDSRVLTSLNLGANEITLKAVPLIVQHLCGKPNLVDLDLNGNWIHQAGIDLIRRARQKAGHKADFTWSDNDMDGDMEGSDESKQIADVTAMLTRL